MVYRIVEVVSHVGLAHGSIELVLEVHVAYLKGKVVWQAAAAAVVAVKATDYSWEFPSVVVGLSLIHI